MNQLARYLDGLDEAAARVALARCCAARRWVEDMLARRPFGDDAAVFAAAEEAWAPLGAQDWHEAMASHPRIGERANARDPSASWSRGEQAGVARADHDVRVALEAGNRAYEQRFGQVFLICATGKRAEQVLAELDLRLSNDPQVEVQVAAGEQAKITRLRLAKLVASGGAE